MKTLLVSGWAMCLVGMCIPIADPDPGNVTKPVPRITVSETTQPVIVRRTVQDAEQTAEIVATVSGLRLSGEESIDQGDLVTIAPEGKGDSYPLWDVRYPPDFEQFAEENGKLFVAMPDRDVGITLTLIPLDFPKSPPIRIRTVLKAKPGPDDDEEEKKPPKPEPDPKPTEKVSAVVVIEQRSDFNEATRILQKSEAWRKLSTSKDIVQRASWYDIDNPEASAFKSAAEAVGLPAILLFDESGDFIQAYPLPKTGPELMELIK